MHGTKGMQYRQLLGVALNRACIALRIGCGANHDDHVVEEAIAPGKLEKGKDENEQYQQQLYLPLCVRVRRGQGHVLQYRDCPIGCSQARTKPTNQQDGCGAEKKNPLLKPVLYECINGVTLSLDHVEHPLLTNVEHLMGYGVHLVPRVIGDVIMSYPGEEKQKYGRAINGRELGKHIHDEIRCFDIGGTKIVGADISHDGTVSEFMKLPTPTENFTAFTALLQEYCQQDDKPISLCIAGVVHPQTGLAKSANIPCISGRALADELSESLSRRVFVINDAKAFALAESRFGRARGHAVALAIILGTGVGGSIVIDDRVLFGNDGTAGEWGHGPASAIRTGYSLPRRHCDCGQISCVDTFGGARGLELLYQEMGFHPLSSEAIVQAWERGDASATQLIDVWLDIVGGALANSVNTISPSIVIVGGGLASSTSLIAALDEEVGTRRLAVHSSTLLHPVVNGPDHGLLGAALNAHNQSGHR